MRRRLVVGLVLALVLTLPWASRAQKPPPAIDAVVIEVEGIEATIDAGSSRGVQVGQLGTVYHYEPGRDGQRRRVKVADVRVSTIATDSAQVAILTSYRDIERHHRVALRPVVEEAKPSRGPERPPDLPPRRPSIAGKSADRPSSPDRRPAPPPKPEPPSAETPKPVEAPCRGTVSVETTPPGASVTIDGDPWAGLTPMTNPSVPCGSHHARIVLDSYEKFSLEVVVTRGATTTVRAALVPAKVRVQIDSSPAGATITLADRAPARAPVVVDITWGDYRVRAEMEGYLPVEQVLHVGGTGPVFQRISLLPCRGLVTVVSEPPGARVVTDDRLSGVAPLTLDLPCGPRALYLRLPGRPEQLHHVVVELAGKHSVRARFPLPATPAPPPPPPPPAPPPTSVLISTFPPGTLAFLGSLYAIELDGRLVVDWGVASVETTVPTTPGPHRVRVLIRPVGIQTPQVIHDQQLSFLPGSPNEIRVNFLLSFVTVNGGREFFNGPDSQLRR